MTCFGGYITNSIKLLISFKRNTKYKGTRQKYKSFLMLMEPAGEKCRSNCLYNHYELWLSFNYITSLEAVRVFATSWKVVYILWKQKDRNGLIESHLMQNSWTVPWVSVSTPLVAVGSHRDLSAAAEGGHKIFFQNCYMQRLSWSRPQGPYFSFFNRSVQ